MDMKIVGLLGAVSALALAPQVADAMTVSSYADLLKPIPNAVALLQASDTEMQARATLLAPATEGDANVQEAQYFPHHHHHFGGYGYGYGPRFGRPFFHPHHYYGYARPFYHHHHHPFFRGYGY